jgi:hypothetical protein
MTVMALLVRADIGGYAFSFVNLTAAESERFAQIVKRFL